MTGLPVVAGSGLSGQELSFSPVYLDPQKRSFGPRGCRKKAWIFAEQNIKALHGHSDLFNAMKQCRRLVRSCCSPWSHQL